MVFLQNCVVVQKSEPPSRAELYLRSSDDTNQVVAINVEVVTDVEEEKSSSALIMTEPAVSSVSMFPLLCTLHRYP
jgi:hypothetical protein